MFPNTYFPNAKKYWYMGGFHDWCESVLHPMTHGLHYGSTVFEGIRAYATPAGPAIFRLPEHVERLLVSAAATRMQPPFSSGEITELVKETVRENGLASCYIRPLLFYSYGNLGLVPRCCPVELVISAWEMDTYFGQKAASGTSVYIVPWRRVHHTQINMAAKLGGVYVQSMTCGLEARMAGYDEAVFLNLEGRVAEGAGENIFIVRNGVLVTNDRSESILEGITRTTLIEIARDLGFETVIRPITRDELLDADEAFFCGTAVEIVPIVSVTDGSITAKVPSTHQIGEGTPGPITETMMDAFRTAVLGGTPRYSRWLTPVAP